MRVIGTSTAIVVGVGIVAALASYVQLQAAPPGAERAVAYSQAETASPERALLNEYCVGCHNDRQLTGGLTLETIDVDDVSGAMGAAWEKVVRRLRGGAMPPAGMPRPDRAAADAFIASLETKLDRAAAVSPNPGGTGIHRLNRVEYTNAIRDLLALEIDGESLFPADPASYGFDNIADVLTVSPGLMERYLSAARTASRLAVSDPTIRPTLKTYTTSPLMLQNGRMSEDLPFGSRGGIAVRHHFPLDGEYVFTISAGGLGRTVSVDVRLDDERLKLLTRDDAQRSDAYRGRQQLQFRTPVKAGSRLVGVALVNGSAAPAVESVRLAALENPVLFGRGFRQAGVNSVQIDGPYNVTGPGDTASRRRIFACRPASAAEEEPCARTILTTLARRAYRRPVTDADVRGLLDFYHAGRRVGGFDTGIQRALEKVLVSLEFLFRMETTPPSVAPGAAYRLSDVELASRLAFFLWSSIPDDELLDLAERGKLTDPAVLEQQVGRMLKDVKADALTTNVGGQWLYLRNMRTVGPAPRTFPEFSDSLREAFQRETELFFQSQVREDHSVLELLTADYTFVNEHLARHYRIPGIYGNHFRRVPVADDTRGGLLGHASILTVTSYSTRTSPTLRGKWVLENILGAPPPPPPPDVPALPEKGEDGETLSMRDRMERHRQNPVCATCHAQMDPIGFALENYDAIGRWRAVGNSGPIDSSGALPDGTTFNGPQELRELLSGRRDEVVTNVVEKFLTYALGRGLEPYDMPAVRKITREAATHSYRWSSVILGIVKSTPFQMRRAES